MQNEAKTCEKFMLFVLQQEAKIMQSGLRFASILHGAKKKNLSEKGTSYLEVAYSRAMGMAGNTPIGGVAEVGTRCS
jgi:hypothetical protein